MANRQLTPPSCMLAFKPINFCKTMQWIALICFRRSFQPVSIGFSKERHICHIYDCFFVNKFTFNITTRLRRCCLNKKCFKNTSQKSSYIFFELCERIKYGINSLKRKYVCFQEKTWNGSILFYKIPIFTSILELFFK